MLEIRNVEQKITLAADKLYETMMNHPECRADIAEEYLRKNEIRPYFLAVITPTFYEPPAELIKLNEKEPKSLTVRERLLSCLLSASMPAQMLNPVSPSVFLGRGPGTLAASFGVPLDPDLGYQPRGCRSIDDLLAEGMPDPENSGIIPEIREEIEAALALTPDWVQIAAPDTQGPFNIAHMVLGEEALVLPYLEPEKFYQFMEMVTDFYIAFYKNLRRWIGEKRYTKFVNSRCRLRECSVNMISKEMYIEHVLPHDKRIAEFFGEVCVHPCSGRHVFYVTMQNLPNIVYHEAMPFENSVAPSITVEEAIAEVGNKAIMLNMSRVLERESAKEAILRDFDIVRQHPSFMFSYNINGFSKEDKDELLRLHDWMNRYWHDNVFAK